MEKVDLKFFTALPVKRDKGEGTEWKYLYNRSDAGSHPIIVVSVWLSKQGRDMKRIKFLCLHSCCHISWDVFETSFPQDILIIAISDAITGQLNTNITSIQTASSADCIFCLTGCNWTITEICTDFKYCAKALSHPLLVLQVFLEVFQSLFAKHWLLFLSFSVSFSLCF